MLQPDMVIDKEAFIGKVALIPLSLRQMITRPVLTTRFVVADGYGAPLLPQSDDLRQRQPARR